MKKIALFLGYLAGFIVGSRFVSHATTKPTHKKQVKKSLGEEALQTGKDFIDSHKKAFEELKKEYWTEENKKLVLSRKKDLEKFFHLVQAEIEEAKVVLKKHGVDTDAIIQKIESIYAEKKEFIDAIAKSADDPKVKTKVRNAKRKLSRMVKNVKDAIQN